MSRAPLDVDPQALIAFLDAAPTPWHAVRQVANRLMHAGFLELELRQPWTLEPGEGYFTTRQDGSLIAWRQPQEVDAWTIFGAHTDSPNLRVRPQPVIKRHGYFQIGVEVYGGALLAPWFDRDLSLAGRVALANQGGVLSELVDFERPIGIIPSLAIHLDREANSQRSINPQDHLPVLIARADTDAELDFKALLAAEMDRDLEEIAAFELCFYPTDFGQIIGLKQEFIASARLDNLLSCWVATEALVRTQEAPDGLMLVLNDHEEIGSQSAIGADSPLLESVLRRVTPADAFERVRASSLLVSIDNGHAVHPNFAAKHDSGHRPLLNEGPVVKINANHRYATTALSQGIVEQAAQRADVPLQYFSSRADMGCGSTIGPITASRLGIDTVDLGMATLAMHSSRELCGVKDPELMLRLLHALATRELFL